MPAIIYFNSKVTLPIKNFGQDYIYLIKGNTNKIIIITARTILPTVILFGKFINPPT